MPPSAKLLRNQIVADVRAGAPVAPRCRHAPPNDLCGGCAFQDRTYAAQVAAKHAALRRLWAPLLAHDQLAAIGFAPSPHDLEYRTRMDYVASKDRLGLRRGGKFNYIVDLQECHLIPPDAFTVVRTVYQRARELGLPDYNLRTHEGYLRYITVRRSPDDELLLAIVTASDDQAEAIDELAQLTLSHRQVVGLHWLHNPGLADVAFGTPLRHWGAATLPMRVGKHTLAIGPNTFFQNNLHLLEPLLEDVRQAVATHDGRPVVDREPSIADLYGGVGTIALYLADSVGEVACVESVGESAALARVNVAGNGVENVTVVESDVGTYLAARAATAPADDSLPSFDVVVADPPRAGLGPEVCRELLRLRPSRIVYVSCNPLTQIEDARLLTPDYRLTALRGYDMFPQTPHLETLAIFDRADVNAP